MQAFGGAIHITRHVQSLVARILRVLLDTDVAHTTGGGPLIIHAAPPNNQPRFYEVSVFMPGKPLVTLEVPFDSMVQYIMTATGWRCPMDLSRDGHDLRNTDLVAIAFGQQRHVMLEARENFNFGQPRVELCPITATTHCMMKMHRDDDVVSDASDDEPVEPIPWPFADHVSRITAQRLLPLCWSTRGPPCVWRKTEALMAARVAALFGASDVLPHLLEHLALPPCEWFRGPEVAGQTTMRTFFYRYTGVLEDVMFFFKPDIPLEVGCHMRLSIEAHPCGTPATEWFVHYTGQ